MAKRIEALANPKLLVWARKTSGLTLEAAADKMNITDDKLLKCEAGEIHLSLAELRKAAKVYKRPLAIFLST